MDLRSIVEKNCNNVNIGTILYYIDDSNCQEWEVIELFDGGFCAKWLDFPNEEPIDYYFDELQIGWRFADKNLIEFE